MNKHKRLLIGLLIVLGILGTATLVFAADPDDYEYYITVVVDNQSGSNLADTPVAVTMRPVNLERYGFLQDDAEDWLPVDTNETELEGVAQGMTSGDVPWWFEVTQNDGTVGTYTFHIGYPSATRDQRFRFDGTTDVVTVPYHSDFDITDDLILDAEIEAYTWAAATGTAFIIRKQGAYELEIGDCSGDECIQGTVTSAGDSATVSTTVDDQSNPLVAGTEYDVVLSYDQDAAEQNLRLYVNDVLVAYADFTDSLATNTNDVTIGSGFNGYIDNVGIDPGVLYSYYNANDDDSDNCVYGTGWLAQTFTPTMDFDLESVRLKLWQTGGATNARLYMYAVDGDGYPIGVPPDAGLFPRISASLSGVGSTQGTAAWVTFDLTEPYTVTNGTQYALVLHHYTGSGGTLYWNADSSSPTYTGGRALQLRYNNDIWYSAFGSVTSLNETVGADADDYCHRDDMDNGAEECPTGDLRIGHSEFVGSYHYHYSTGVRFQGVAVPTTNKRVIYATVTGVPDSTRNNVSMATNIYGEDDNDADAFTDSANYAARTRTTAYASFFGTRDFVQDTPYVFPAITDVIVEITDRGDWVSGGDMAILLDQVGGSGLTNLMSAYPHETDPSKVYELDIDYVIDDDATGDFMFELWGSRENDKARYTFEPDEMESTQEGIPSNSWIWTGTINDQSPSSNSHTANYSLTRDLSNINIWIEGVERKTIPTPVPTPTGITALGSTSLTPVATREDVNFFLRPHIEGLLEHSDTGMTHLAMWFVFWFALGLIASTALWFGTKMAYLSVIPVPTSIWIGWAMGTPITLWIALLWTFVALGIGFGLYQFRER